MSRNLRRLLPALALALLAAPLAAKDEPRYNSDPVVPVPTAEHKAAVKLLVDRGEIYPDAIAMCEMAKEEILLNIYLFGGFDNFTQGEDYVGIGKSLVDVMARKQAEGVRVRIITPRPGENIERQAYIKSKVKAFRNKIRGFLNKPELPPPSEPGYTPVFYYARENGLPTLASNTKVLGGGASWKLDHSKLLIVDGKEALIGGMNFAETVASNRDAMTRVAGPVVKELKAIFANVWDYSVQQALANGEEIAGDVQAAKSLATCDDTAIAEHLAARLAEGWSPSDIRITLSSPYRNDTRQAIVDALGTVGEGDKVSVEMLLMTDKPCIQALIEAHQRGAEVRVILDPNESLYGVNCMGAPNVIAVRRFLEVDLPVHNYEPEPGQELHMKMMLIQRKDGSAEFAMGSTNWTVGAFDSNFEMFAFYRNCKSVTDRLAREFEHDWVERSEPSGFPPKLGDVDVVQGEKAKQRNLSTLQKIIEAFVDSFDQKIF